MSFASRLAACAVASSLLAAPAIAATVTRTFDVDIYDFVDVLSGAPAPVDPLLASFTLTYDPDAAVENTTDGLVVNSLNITFAGYLAYSYTPGVGGGVFRFGAITQAGDDVSTFLGNADDAYITFTETPAGFPLGASSSYFRAALPDSTWISETGTVEATGTPEPSAWALMILGFGACGAALRRRTRAAA